MPSVLWHMVHSNNYMIQYDMIYIWYRLALCSALRIDLSLGRGALDKVAGAQAKTLGSNVAHTVQLGQKLTVYSRQKNVHRAMATGDIRVIDLLMRDTTHTQHSPSGLVLCMRRITH